MPTNYMPENRTEEMRAEHVLNILVETVRL